MHSRAFHKPSRRQSLRAAYTVVRLVVAHSQAVLLEGNHSNSWNRPVGKVLGPPAMGMVACLWKCLQACEPRMKTPSQCCWDSRISRSLTVAQVGSHICWAEPLLRVVRVPWSDSGLASENDFWTWSVLEAYDHSGGETWYVVRSQTVSRAGKCERGDDQQHQGMMYRIVLFAERV